MLASTAPARPQETDWIALYAELQGPDWEAAAWTSIERLSPLERALEPAAQLSDQEDHQYWCLYLALSQLIESGLADSPLELFRGAETELGERAPEVLRELSQALLQQARDEEAERLAAHGLEAFPASTAGPGFWWVRAESARRAWRADEALEAAARGLEAAGDEASITRQLLLESKARTLTTMGVPELAIGPLGELRATRERAAPEERFPLDMLVHREAAWAIAVGDPEQALAILAGRELPPESQLLEAMAWIELGGAERLGRAAQVLRELRSNELASELTRRSATVRLAELQLAAGDVAGARALLDDPSGAAPSHLDERLLVEALRARVELAQGAPAPVLLERYASLGAVFDDVVETRETVELREGGLGLLHFDDVLGALSAIIDLGRRLGDDELALTHVFAVRDLGSLARSLGGPPTDLERVRAALPEGSGVLSYLPTPEHTYLFLIDEKEVRCELLPPPAAWEEAQNQVQKLLMSPPPERPDDAARRRLDALLEELSSALLPPAVRAALEGWSQVQLEGLGLAGYVPFEALPLEQGPVGLSLPVTWWPSLSTAARLEARSSTRPAPTAELAVLAAPDDIERDPIPWHDEHTRRLARHCSPSGLRIRTAEEASVAALVDEQFLRASWLLLVLHGTYDAAREQPSGFLVGRDAQGRQAELFAPDLQRFAAPPLVFLAICGAARGPLRRGDDGVSNLGGTLLKAGADAVVLSPIDVMFEPVALLAGYFQRALAEGAAASEALFRARHDLLREHPELDHPYYYATLHLVGRGSLCPYAAPLATRAEGEGRVRRRALWIAAGLALALLGALAQARGRRAPSDS